jgi:hypothetical protein
MAKQNHSRKQKQRKSRQRKSRRCRQSGGSLAQGQAFANIHRAQHGGSRELVGAPLGYTGVLDAGMRGAAGVEKYDQHFAQAQAQAGGSRRRRAMRGGASPADVGHPYTLLPSYAGAGVPPPSSVSLASQASPASHESHASPSAKGGRRQRKSRSKSKSKRNQRGGFSPVNSPSMLLSSGEYDKAGLHPDFKNPL